MNMNSSKRCFKDMDFRIKKLNDANIGLWEDFNQKMSKGTFFHTTKWKKVIESLGYNSHYFLILDGDQTVAICPFFETEMKKFKGITALPLSDYNHIVIKDNNPLMIDFIIKELKTVAKKESWSYIIFNFLGKELINNLKNSFIEYSPTGTMNLDLEKLNHEKIWNEVFSARRGQRKYINRLIKDGFQIKELNTVAEFKIFYEYYIKNMEYIKGKKFPYSHFIDLYNLYYPNNLQISILHKEDLFAGGSINFLDPSKETLYLRYLAFNRDLPQYHIPHLLWWEAIKTADKLGFKKVCMGSTPSDITNSNYKRKKSFGCNYQKIYPILIPTSKLFNLSLKMINSIPFR